MKSATQAILALSLCGTFISAFAVSTADSSILNRTNKSIKVTSEGNATVPKNNAKDSKWYKVNNGITYKVGHHTVTIKNTGGYCKHVPHNNMAPYIRLAAPLTSKKQNSGDYNGKILALNVDGARRGTICSTVNAGSGIFDPNAHSTLSIKKSSKGYSYTFKNTGTKSKKDINEISGRF